MTLVEIRHAHMFCSIGMGAKGFNQASPRAGQLQGRMRCIGGIDVDPARIRDFGRIAGTPGTVLDLFDRDQYIDFHGHEPPPGWREATPADVRAAFGNEHPHILFLSAPCKGFSGLLSESRSQSVKYKALNRSTLRGIWLALEAYADDPVELIVFENVPRIATRGQHLLDQIDQLLHRYRYATADTTHDCGEIGGLAQSRKRFLKVARHVEKVPAFLYQPERRPLRAVGEVLGRMLLPGDLRAGPMHRVPNLQWKTWVRLAFVEAGSDWRSLNRLAIEDGRLRDYLVVPAGTDWHSNVLGVRSWGEPSGTVTSNAKPSTGSFCVADPRPAAMAEYQQYGVRRWEAPTGAVSGQSAPGGGSYSVADPRMPASENRHYNLYRVVRWDRATQCVTGAQQVGSGAGCVADPRPDWNGRHGHLHVADWERHSRTVTAGGKGVQGGWMSVADPRPAMQRTKGDHYLTGGHYGVVPWTAATGAVSGSACHDNGPWSVADPRAMPAADAKLVAMIRAEDGTWHRPFTTLELAALQSLIDPEEQLELDGLSDSAWRERIGDGVPSASAKAVAEVMGQTLLLAWSGETFILSAQPVWVRPMAVALSVAGPAVEATS